MGFKYGVLIIGNNELNSSDVIKMITNENSNLKDIEGVFCRTWAIKNKYYDAEVYLCGLNHKNVIPSKLELNLEAIIIYFNSKSVQSIREFDDWLVQIKPYQPSVRILLCNTYEIDVNVPKTCTEDWCIKHSFELIELKSPADEIDDLTNEFGIERVRQALYSHVWPNLILKEECPESKNTKTQDQNCHVELNMIEKELRNMELEEEFLNDLKDGDDRLLSATDRFGELLVNLNSWRSGLIKITSEEKLNTATKLVSQAFQSIVLSSDERSSETEEENDRDEDECTSN